MTPSERRQVAALLRRVACVGERCGACFSDGIRWLASTRKLSVLTLREWYATLPKMGYLPLAERALLALLLADAIEAGDLP